MRPNAPACLKKAPLTSSSSWKCGEALWGIHTTTYRWMETMESREELERIYAEFKKVKLLQWRSATSNRTAKFQSHSDAQLEALVKYRDKIFRKLKKSRQDCTGLWSKFHALDKQFKKKVRNKKNVLEGRKSTQWYRSRYRKRRKGLRSICRDANTAAMQSLQRGSLLDLPSFKRHM